MNKRTALSENLAYLRNAKGYSLESLAEKIGVTRQAIAKWETGETLPDIIKCEALAELYQVTLDDLVTHETQKNGYPIPPKGKHIFGMVKVGERGQIVLPKNARETMDINKGDVLAVLGDENPESFGIALVPGSYFLKFGDLLGKITNQTSSDEQG